MYHLYSISSNFQVNALTIPTHYKFKSKSGAVIPQHLKDNKVHYYLKLFEIKIIANFFKHRASSHFIIYYPESSQ